MMTQFLLGHLVFGSGFLVAASPVSKVVSIPWGAG